MSGSGESSAPEERDEFGFDVAGDAEELDEFDPDDDEFDDEDEDDDEDDEFDEEFEDELIDLDDEYDTTDEDDDHPHPGHRYDD